MSGAEQVTIHASCVAIGGRAVLIAGASGSGKSDLTYRLIDRGAQLVTDDRAILSAVGGALIVRAPDRIAGRIELRGVGIIDLPFRPEAPAALLIDLDLAPERLPQVASRIFLGIAVPVIGFSALEASAAMKVEAALQLHGLNPPCRA